MEEIFFFSSSLCKFSRKIKKNFIGAGPTNSWTKKQMAVFFQTYVRGIGVDVEVIALGEKWTPCGGGPTLKPGSRVWAMVKFWFNH